MVIEKARGIVCSAPEKMLLTFGGPWESHGRPGPEVEGDEHLEASSSCKGSQVRQQSRASLVPRSGLAPLCHSPPEGLEGEGCWLTWTLGCQSCFMGTGLSSCLAGQQPLCDRATMLHSRLAVKHAVFLLIFQMYIFPPHFNISEIRTHLIFNEIWKSISNSLSPVLLVLFVTYVTDEKMEEIA